jgi:hypothetical protein
MTGHTCRLVSLLGDYEAYSPNSSFNLGSIASAQIL